MPINIALLFCIPIGILFYFEARWLIRFFLGRYEQKERRAAWLFGAFGALSIPLIYCSGRAGYAISAKFGSEVAGVLFGIPAVGLIGLFLKTLMGGKWRNFDSNH